MFHKSKLHTKKYVVTIINEHLNSSGSVLECSYDALSSYITTIEDTTHEEKLWFVLFGTWDDKTITNELVKKIKSMFGIDFCNHQKHGFIVTLSNCAFHKCEKNY